jgi:hypothetical protein
MTISPRLLLTLLTPLLPKHNKPLQRHPVLHLIMASPSIRGKLFFFQFHRVFKAIVVTAYGVSP